MLTSSFLLTMSYLFHLIATVVWVGGLVVLAVIVQPVINNVTSDPKEQARYVEAIQKRFQPIANLCLIVLILTGLVQTVNNRFYIGFLQFDNTWSQAILLKHICVVIMIVLAGVITFSVQPALRRNALLVANDIANEAESARLKVQQVRLTRLNLVLSLLVLLFTAVARVQ